MMALAAAAAWARWPDLYTLPVLTDEANELYHALAAWRAGEAPLFTVFGHVGGLWSHALMLAFSVAGPSPFVGRTLVFVAGCATVALTYLLGRLLHGRWVGLLAGALLVPNTVHALAISHIGWSNCLTPLFATLTLLALTLAVTRRRPALLLLAGLLAGLTLQTHLSAAPLLLGFGLGLLSLPVGRRWLTSPWAPASVMAVIIGLLPLVIFNIQTPGGTLRAAQRLPYALHPATSIEEYIAEASRLLIQLTRALASVMEAPDSLASLLVRPQVAPLLALLAVGFGAAWRSGPARIGPLALLVSLGVTAYTGGEYVWLPSNSSRYLAPLWPICYVLIGLGAVTVANWGQRGATWLARRMGAARLAWGRWLVVAGLAVGLAGAGLYSPWRATEAYRAWHLAQPRVGDFNAAVYALARRARQEWPGETIWLGRELASDGLQDGGTAWAALRMVFEASGIATLALPTTASDNLTSTRALIGDEPALVLLSHDRAAGLMEQGAYLEPLATYQSGRLRNRGAWSLYRLGPANAP